MSDNKRPWAIAETAGSTFIGQIGEEDNNGRMIIHNAFIHTPMNTPVQTQGGFGVQHDDIIRPFGPLLHAMKVRITPLNLIMFDDMEEEDRNIMHELLKRTNAQLTAAKSRIAMPPANASKLIVPAH